VYSPLVLCCVEAHPVTTRFERPVNVRDGSVGMMARAEFIGNLERTGWLLYHALNRPKLLHSHR